MPTYVSLFKYNSQALKGLMNKPSDRSQAVRQLAESVGGRLVGAYLLFGQYDGVVIFEAPDSQSAAAMMIAVGGSGAFSHVETHEAIPAEQGIGILERASTIAYTPPGG